MHRILLFMGIWSEVAAEGKPPMGWMSWMVFRCNVDCENEKSNCIDEKLFRETAQALYDGGYVDAGYKTVSIDDCWESSERIENQLLMNASRFPSGPKSLSAFMQLLGIKFGIYSDEGTHTCQGYPGSLGFEEIDADTFQDWGVGYLKLDGCNNNISAYADGYTTFGKALQDKNITYSCSWPAYLGTNESVKPYTAMAEAGCDLWRNYQDIQCSWESLASVIDHFGNYSEFLQQVTLSTKAWNDPDMLLIGNDCISIDEARTQFAVWSILAAPLIMGNDLRNVTAEAQQLLLNKEAIAVDQDPLGIPGTRLNVTYAGGIKVSELWRRYLQNGDMAVALLNRQDSATSSFTLDFVKDLAWPLDTPAIVRDIFSHTTLGSFPGNASINVREIPPHGAAFLRISSSTFPFPK